MYLRYGNYSHAIGDAVVTITAQSLRSQAGIQYGIEETWSIRGMLQGSTQAALTQAIAQLAAAYAVDYFGIGLFQDDGTPTQHVRTGVTTVGGVTVEQPPHFPEGGGAEYSTFRTYQIVVKARYPVLFQANGGLLSWMETLTFVGTGGPKFVYLQPLLGLPQKQLTASATTQTITQAGEAVGLFGYPLVPPPISPADEHQERRRIEPKTAKRLGQTPVYLEYPISWSYEFEVPVPANALPTLWT